MDTIGIEHGPETTVNMQFVASFPTEASGVETSGQAGPDRGLPRQDRIPRIDRRHRYPLSIYPSSAEARILITALFVKVVKHLMMFPAI